MTIEDLKRHVEKLSNLANDPHPGLASWREQLDKAIEGLYADYAKPTDQTSGNPRASG